MKKFLSLLSIVTISGTAVPTTIAASPYQKEEYKIENSDINLQSKNLIRIKRQVRKKYKSLRELITNFNLGELRDNYEDTILHAIERLNPTVNSNDIRIVKIPNNNTALIAWSHATNSVGINDDVIWVQFSISSEGIVGNSRFYNIPINIDGPEISNPTLQHSTNEITKQSLISVGEKAGTSGISQQHNSQASSSLTPIITNQNSSSLNRIQPFNKGNYLRNISNLLKTNSQSTNRNTPLSVNNPYNKNKKDTYIKNKLC